MTQQTLSFIGLKDLGTVETGNILTGDDEIVTITPPAGFVYKLIQISFDVDAVAAAGDGGTHHFTIYNGNKNPTDWAGQFIKLVSNYNEKIVLAPSGEQRIADSSKLPADTANQYLLHTAGIWAHPDMSIKMRYKNEATTATQSNDRTYSILAEVYRQVF